MTHFLSSPLPLVAAPMAGGPSSVELARATVAAGAFPFLAGGYKSAETLRVEIDTVRAFTDHFGVNLFVPSRTPVDTTAFRGYVDRLRTEADAYGIELDAQPVQDTDAWDDKLQLLLETPVPVVSLTFGLPPVADIIALRNVGTTVVASVTTALEARRSEEAGVNGLVVQGPDAGGHSATHNPISTGSPGGELSDLVRQIRIETNLPIIATGGVDGPEAVRQLLDAGADTVAVGTLLLRTDEAGTSRTHRSALADSRYTETVVTTVFTGRPARALRNGFIDRHDANSIHAYPAVHHLTRALRAAAAGAGDADRLHLWAGTGWRSAPTGAASEVFRQLSSRI